MTLSPLTASSSERLRGMESASQSPLRPARASCEAFEVGPFLGEDVALILFGNSRGLSVAFRTGAENGESSLRTSGMAKALTLCWQCSNRALSCAR
jgi:hypothetical protein